MAELLKNIYNQEFLDGFADVITEIIPDFDKLSFVQSILDNTWESRALKERMRHITLSLKAHLSGDFAQNVDNILRIIQQLQNKGVREESIEYMIFPDFIEVYGREDYTTSVNAFERITQFTSCEFAVRPFILDSQDKMVDQMRLWSTHVHPMVRRLSSEGCRPRLPWAMAIPAFKKDPGPILPILENLKNDTWESVRRSVANNLNDISKDNPETVVHLAKKWKGHTKTTDWVVKHACRTLLKQGNPEVMELFGFGSIDEIEVRNHTILTPVVKMGDALRFSFALMNTSGSPSKIRLEYGLYYQKANGSLSKKIFMISEREYPPHSTTEISRKQSFKRITTRKFYPGLHQLSIIVNGHEIKTVDFELTEA
ncbi:MAG: DNA alkylation repair protein [Flavobacteriaceae bacterium]